MGDGHLLVHETQKAILESGNPDAAAKASAYILNAKMIRRLEGILKTSRATLSTNYGNFLQTTLNKLKELRRKLPRPSAKADHATIPPV